MTSTVDIRPAGAVGTPGRVGQATAVEQSRAVAEVHAAIVVAQQVPRDITRAVAEALRSCAQRSLAERAFFRYNRGGSQISGPSVQLARELARCWGNVQYGLTELRRDDGYRQSEMQAWAWDVQTNARSSTTFIVPHARDKDSKVTELTALRDIYENNANNGARRLREMIFAILPGWYTEDAIAACYETLNGDEATDGTLAERAAKAIGLFGALKVTQAQLEQKLGAPRTRWSAADLATLHVIYRSVMRGETTKEEEFGGAPERVTAAGIKPVAPAAQEPAAPSNGAAKQEAAPPQPSPAPRFRRLTKPTLGKLRGDLASLPLGSSEDRAEALSVLAGRQVKMPEELSRDEAEVIQAVLDGALEGAGGDKEQAAGKVWEHVRGKLAAQAQDASAEAAEGEVPDGGA